MGFVLVMGVSVAASWVGPTAEPPDENAPAPINVSSNAQTKEGDLTIKGILHVLNDTFLDGKVGIGTTFPRQKLDVLGQIHASDDVCTDAGGGKCLSTAGGPAGGVVTVSSEVTCRGSRSGNKCDLGSTSEWKACFLTGFLPFTSSGSWDAGCNVVKIGDEWKLSVFQTGGDGLDCSAICVK